MVRMRTIERTKEEAIDTTPKFLPLVSNKLVTEEADLTIPPHYHKYTKLELSWVGGSRDNY